MFKKRRGIHIPYNDQGLIYFTCMSIKKQPQEVQDKILNLCMYCAGENYQALYECMTNDHISVAGIAMKYFIAERTLYNYRKKFYESWEKFREK